MDLLIFGRRVLLATESFLFEISTIAALGRPLLRRSIMVTGQGEPRKQAQGLNVSSPPIYSSLSTVSIMTQLLQRLREHRSS